MTAAEDEEAQRDDAGQGVRHVDRQGQAHASPPFAPSFTRTETAG